MATDVEFSVTGEQKIHCEGCEDRIERVLKRLSGVEAANASAKEQRVSVSINPTRINAEQIQTKLQELGYEVKPAKAA